MPLLFPYPLPTVDKAWLEWNDDTVIKLSRTIREDKRYDLMPILADALEEAGCADAAILEHCRQPRIHRNDRCYHGGPYEYGCWANSCWVVRLLLGYDQAVRARRVRDNEGVTPGPEGLYTDGEYLPVVNPGGWWGETWLVVVGAISAFVVEGDHASDAEDEFVDSDFGKTVRIAHDSPEAVDWGEAAMCYVGQTVGGLAITEEIAKGRYLNLKGELVDTVLPAPQYTGNGNVYDSEEIQVFDGAEYEVLYYGPGLPPEGLEPDVYADGMLECLTCEKKFWPGVVQLKHGCGEFCSDACHDAAFIDEPNHSAEPVRLSLARPRRRR